MTCQWPIGDPKKADFHFCGDPDVVKDKPYCQIHCDQAYIKIRDYVGQPFVICRPRILAQSLQLLDAE